MSFGTGAAVMRVDGKAVRRSPTTRRSATSSGRAASRGRCPSRGARPAADERPRRHRRHRHGGAVGIIADRNGPWLSERLRERGVELAHIIVVGDRPGGRARRARLPRRRGRRPDPHHRRARARPPTTSRPTSSARFAGREMVLDAALEERILAILRRHRARWRLYSEEAMRAGNRKQAVIPAGRDDPRAGRDRARARRAARGRRRSARRRAARAAARAAADVGGGASRPRAAAARCSRARRRSSSGSCASSACRSPRSRVSCARSRRTGVPLDELEITTCLRRGELEIATVFAPGAAPAYDAFVAADPRAPRRRAVLRRTARRSTSRSRRCCAGARSRSPSRAPAA